MTVSATAAIAKGDLQVGRARLATAAAAFREVALSSARPDRASSALLAARDAFDELTSLAVRRGTVGEALSIVEQKRRSLRPWTFRDIGTANPTRGIVVSYALVGDTLLTWVLRGADTAFFRSTTRRDALRSAIGVARTSLRLHAPESVARRQLGILYDQLIRPVESAMAGAGLVTFVADDAIADLPFAALWNESRREYLLDRYTIALAPSIPTNEPAERSSGGGALFIAGVGTDLNRADAWAALPGAKGEVSAGSSEYPTRTVLGEDQATSEALIARLPLSAVVHFAGHAVLDNRNFERSYLALKPRGITALQISQLDLRSVRLVVLAACETATRESDGGGGLMGFADAFLSAGAQGVIGSLWPVDDASTQRLMTAFHRIYSRSRDPTSALRDAQLLERARGLPPAEWAAFQYTRR